MPLAGFYLLFDDERLQVKDVRFDKAAGIGPAGKRLILEEDEALMLILAGLGELL